MSDKNAIITIQGNLSQSIDWDRIREGIARLPSELVSPDSIRCGTYNNSQQQPNAIDSTRGGTLQTTARPGEIITLGSPVILSDEGVQATADEEDPGIIGHALSEPDEHGNILVRLDNITPGSWTSGDTVTLPDGVSIDYYDSTGNDDEDGYHEIRDDILAAMLLFMYLELKKPLEERSAWSQFDKRIRRVDSEYDWSQVKCEFTITMDDLRHAQQELGTMRQVIEMAKSMMPKPSGKKLRRLVKF